MPELSVVWWEEASREAESMFRVWTEGRELEWAHKSWDALAKRGLTAYSNQVEWTRVMVRLMALAAIYRDFCELAFGEIHEPEYTCWVDDLSLSTFRIAQCVGPEFHRDEDADDAGLVESALLELMETARTEIHKVLLTEFGGDSLLLVSLWNTVDYGRDEDAELSGTESEDAGAEIDQGGEDQENQTQPAVLIHWRKDAESILNDVTGQKLAAFNWIQEGMCSVH
jgi:hypothetical protein